MILKTFNIRALINQIAQADREGDNEKSKYLIKRLRRITKPMRDLCLKTNQRLK